MSKSSGAQTVTQTTTPPAFQVPYLTGGINNPKGVPGVLPAAAAWFQSNAPQYFPNNTVAPLTPTQNTALGLLGETTPSPLNTAASDYLQRTLAPGYGQQNLDAVYNQVAAHVMPSVQAAFTGAGRSGSPLEAVNLTDQLTQGFAPYALQAQQATAQQQAQAAGMVPSISGLTTQQLLQALNAGTIQQQQGQSELNDAINRWNFNQNLPLSKLQDYANLVGGNFGQTSTTSQPLYSNPAAGAIGGAATGAGIASSLGATGPWGWAAAGLGGLLGLI